jgi:hypothetical protein
MAEFGWSYISCGDVLTGSGGPHGAVQYRTADGIDGTSAFIFDTGSNSVGIGLHSWPDTDAMPNATLHVVGDVSVTGTIYATEYQILNVTRIEEEGSTKFGTNADDDHEFTGSVKILGNLSASNGMQITDHVQHNNGLSNFSGNRVTFNSDVTASNGMLIPDDTLLRFGTGGDATIEYDENGTDELRFAGAAVTFEQAVSFDGNATFGLDDTGVDVRIHSATTNEGILYDASEDELGLLLTTKLSFHDIGGGENILASSNGHLEVNAGTTLDMTAPSIEIHASTVTTIDSPIVSVESSTSSRPRVVIKNTTNDANSGVLRFVKDKGAAGAADDNVGVIEFYGDDANQDQVLFGRIRTRVAVHTDGQEGGKMHLSVASHDGELNHGLVITDGDAEDEVDVTIANGASSITTISGELAIPTKIFHVGDTDTFISFTDDDINFQAGGVNFLDLTEDTQNEVTFNEAGADIDFRVETADETHMLFIEGSSNRMSIGDNTGSPGATLEVKNHASAGATGVPLVQLNSNDTDQQCLDINASNITANVVNVTANAVTTARVLAIGADGLTTGNALYVDDNSSDTGTRNTALIIQNNAAAIAATAFTVQSDGGISGIKLDKNFSDTTAATVTGLNIDFDKTGASTSNNTMYGLNIDMDNTTATNGNNYMYGLHVTPTLTHAADAGGAFVYGALINAQGGTNGSSLITGARIEAGGGDFNYGLQLDVEDGGIDLRIESSADSGDYFQIQTTTHGATTITTVDDDATAADLTFTIDGDIILGPAGGDVLPDGDNTRNLGSAAKRWANIYTGDLHLKNDRGDWTIVEEEDFLCVINNKTGKKFKMNLIPLEDDE